MITIDSEDVSEVKDTRNSILSSEILLHQGMIALPKEKRQKELFRSGKKNGNGSENETERERELRSSGKVSGDG